MNSLMRVQSFSTLVLMAALMMAGCGHQVPAHPLVLAGLPADDRSILAGEWEYEDGGAVVLRLDEQGNGTYAFKDGRFQTLQFGGGVWVGKWYQKENDREGGFLVNLSRDFEEGEGKWWYDRIGTNTSPSEKGGIFHLTKKTSMTSLSETPPAP